MPTVQCPICMGGNQDCVKCGGSGTITTPDKPKN